MKKIKFIIPLFLFITIFSFAVSAANVTYVVVSGDSMWKIAVKYQVGISEILNLNPQIKNAAVINIGDRIVIPDLSSVKTLENEVVRLVNIQRANNGLGALVQDWQFSRMARIKSADMIKFNYFSHTSPTYGTPFQMMTAFGFKYTAAGENIAYGQSTPAAVMQAWMNSAGHRANILSPNYKVIGVGAAKNTSGQIYWTQEFLSR